MSDLIGNPEDRFSDVAAHHLNQFNKPLKMTESEMFLPFYHVISLIAEKHVLHMLFTRHWYACMIS